MTSVTIDYYDALGVGPDAMPEQLRAAYRRAVLHHHPDRPGGSHERMVLVNEAWEVLSDPAARAAYDALRAEPQDAGAQARWEGVSEAAHERAQSYAKDWEEFRRQMDALLGDVAARIGRELLKTLPGARPRGDASAQLFAVLRVCFVGLLLDRRNVSPMT